MNPVLLTNTFTFQPQQIMKSYQLSYQVEQCFHHECYMYVSGRPNGRREQMGHIPSLDNVFSSVIQDNQHPYEDHDF